MREAREAPERSARGLGPALWVALASLAASLAIAALFPLIDPDEGRNAEVAREMATTGRLLVPHLAGMPYLDKPPAFFWAAAASIRTFGAHPWAARLPSVVAGFLVLWLIGRLARRIEDDDFTVRALALLAVAPLFAAMSAYVIFDMMLAACVTVVWTGLAGELEDRRAGATGGLARRRLLMFTGVTLGVLVKGPVMLAWGLGGSLAVAIVMRSRAPLAWAGYLPGWAMVFGLAGGWFALASRAFPEYPRYAFLEESLERLTSGSFKREQPLWFVPAVLAGGAFPWSLSTPWFRGGWRARHARGGASLRVALGFLLFAAVFFSVSRSKLVTYLLPALPPLAWLAASAWRDAEARDRRWRAWRIASLAVPVLLWLAGGPALIGFARRESGQPLAEAIRARAEAGAIRYERCYSPGTDYLLGRDSDVVSELGHEIRSTYQIRYRETLAARGLWTPLSSAPEGGHPPFLVRRSKGEPMWPAGYREFFRDRRFAAAARTP